MRAPSGTMGTMPTLPDSPRVPAPGRVRPFRVLMVCTGNICRSTMAEEVLREAAARAGLPVVVDSAGISDEERGNPIDPRAARVLREAGYAVPEHRARRVRAGELGSWDLVLAMTRWHMDSLVRLARGQGLRVITAAAPGEAGAVDIRMYRSLDPAVPERLRSEGLPGDTGGENGRAGYGDDRGALDVPDPWYGDHEDFVDTLAVLRRTTPEILGVVRAGVAAGPVGAVTTDCGMGVGGRNGDGDAGHGTGAYPR